MNLSQRLRQLAASTGLDGFAHELRAIADEMEAQPADVTDEQILTEAARHLGEMHVENCGLSDIKDFARAILALRPVQSTFCEYCGGNDEEPVDHCMDCTRPVQAQQPKCKCGDRLASQCDEEWGPKCDLGNNEKYVRVAQQPKPQPMTPEQINEMALQEEFLLVCDGVEELTEIVRAVEAHHGITAQAKKEAP